MRNTFTGHLLHIFLKKTYWSYCLSVHQSLLRCFSSITQSDWYFLLSINPAYGVVRCIVHRLLWNPIAIKNYKIKCFSCSVFIHMFGVWLVRWFSNTKSHNTWWTIYEHFTFRIIQRKAEMQAKLHMELIPAQLEIKTWIEVRAHL